MIKLIAASAVICEKQSSKATIILMVHVDVHGATVDLDQNVVWIKSTTFVGRKALGATERTLLVDHLRALKFKSPSTWSNGCITLVDDAGKTLLFFRRKQERQARALFEQLAASAPPKATSPEAVNRADDAPFEAGPGEAYMLTHDETRWHSEYERMSSLVEEVRNFTGADADVAASAGFTLPKGEHMYLVIDDAVCIEPRPGQGAYQGGSRGFTFRLTRGISYRVGASRGTFAAGPEEPTIIDTGVAAITDKRVLFSGPKQSREWQFAKLIGPQHDIDGCWTALPVANRQRTSGMGYNSATAELIRFMLELAIADFHGRRDELIGQLETERDRLSALRPMSGLQPDPSSGTVQVGGPTMTPPAGWYPDPQGQARLRWWDGRQWTRRTA